MASKEVMDAVKARLQANWTRCTVSYGNKEAAPPAAPFLMVQYPVAEEQQITVGSPGNNVFREEGAIRLVLQVKRGSGLDEWAGWMNELRALFRGKQFGGVTTYAPSPEVLDDRNDDGLYWALSCAIPYKYDRFA